jgi:hypothetical protein
MRRFSGRAAMRTPSIILAVVATAVLAACSNESGPYLDVTGGSFIFNYRLATASAGAVVVAQRNLPENATVELTFEDPAGGPPFVLTENAAPGVRHFSFTVEPLSGVVKDVAYIATVRLLDSEGNELERIDTAYRSKIDQSILGDKPLTVGPGYTPNPEAAR